MISYDDVTYEWETRNGKKTLVILINNVQEPADDDKGDLEKELTSTLEWIFRG